MESEVMRRRLLLVAFCAVGVAAVAITGRQSYTRARASIEHATFERLTALREGKRREIQTYFADLRGHMGLLGGSETITRAMTGFDEASDALRTFPADPFMLDLVRSTQRLYYPEFLADPHLPAQRVQPAGTSESLGSLRYGRLFEGLLYDCRRFLTNELEPSRSSGGSRFVPADVEAWLVARTRRSPCRHLAHMPSTPVLWTAGK